MEVVTIWIRSIIEKWGSVVGQSVCMCVCVGGMVGFVFWGMGSRNVLVFFAVPFFFLFLSFLFISSKIKSFSYTILFRFLFFIGFLSYLFFSFRPINDVLLLEGG